MKKKVIKNLPNLITLSRIIVLIFGFILFMKGNIITSICLYIYGSISDALDGYLARRLNAYSKLGSYLDAISDKLYAFSIILISILHGNYLIIIVAVLEIIISIVSYLVIKKNGTSHTERVGKFKMTFEFILLIISLIMIKYKNLWYIYVILLILTIYYQIQCIFAYINQRNNKKYGLELDYTNKFVFMKSKMLIKEGIYYLLHPVRIIK